MKRLFFIIAAIAWIGLSSYPAYADEGKKESGDKTEVVAPNKSDKKDATAPAADKEPQKNDKGSEASNENTKATEKAVKKIKLVPKNEVIGVAALAILTLIVSLLSLVLVYRKLNNRINEKAEDQASEIRELKKENNEFKESLEDNANYYKKEIDKLQSELSLLKAKLSNPAPVAQNQPKVETVVTPPVYQKKTWYGMYESSREGFSAKYLTDCIENNSQFVIIQTSDNSAEFSIIEELSNDLFSGAREACNVLEGDPMNFSRINVVRSGQLSLEGNTWKVVEPVQIRLC